MTAKLKSLILLFALIALPLRGMAAVAMWHCVQDQRDTTSVSADQHAEDRGMHGDHADHSHGAAAHENPSEHPASPAASACSACSACCVGGAVAPAAWPAFSFARIGASRIPFTERRFTGFVPAQLERPPLLQSL